MSDTSATNCKTLEKSFQNNKRYQVSLEEICRIPELNLGAVTDKEATKQPEKMGSSKEEAEYKETLKRLLGIEQNKMASADEKTYLIEELSKTRSSTASEFIEFLTDYRVPLVTVESFKTFLDFGKKVALSDRKIEHYDKVSKIYELMQKLDHSMEESKTYLKNHVESQVVTASNLRTIQEGLQKTSDILDRKIESTKFTTKEVDNSIYDNYPQDRKDKIVEKTGKYFKYFKLLINAGMPPGKIVPIINALKEDDKNEI